MSFCHAPSFETSHKYFDMLTSRIQAGAGIVSSALSVSTSIGSPMLELRAPARMAPDAAWEAEVSPGRMAGAEAGSSLERVGDGIEGELGAIGGETEWLTKLVEAGTTGAAAVMAASVEMPCKSSAEKDEEAGVEAAGRGDTGKAGPEDPESTAGSIRG